MFLSMLTIPSPNFSSPLSLLDSPNAQTLLLFSPPLFPPLSFAPSMSQYFLNLLIPLGIVHDSSSMPHLLFLQLRCCFLYTSELWSFCGVFPSVSGSSIQYLPLSHPIDVPVLVLHFLLLDLLLPPLLQPVDLVTLANYPLLYNLTE